MSYDIEREVVFRRKVEMPEEFAQLGVHSSMTTMTNQSDGDIVVEVIEYIPGGANVRRIALDKEMVSVIVNLFIADTIGKVPSK